MRIQSTDKCGLPLHCNYSQIHSGFEQQQHLFGVPFIVKIDIFRIICNRFEYSRLYNPKLFLSNVLIWRYSCNIMAEGFRCHAFGFCKAENLSAQWMAYLGATLTQVFTRVRWRSGRIIQRCPNSPHWKLGNGVWMTSRTGRARTILGDFKKVS